MTTCSTFWNQLTSPLDERDLAGFLQALGRRTSSGRALLYRSVCDIDTVVVAEWFRPEEDDELPLDEGTLRTLTVPLSEAGDCLALQRHGAAYSPAEQSLLETAALLVEQARRRWNLEDHCQQLEARLETATQRLTEQESAARTWQRRAEAIDVYSKGLTHHCLTNSRALAHLANSITKESGFCPPPIRQKFETLQEIANRHQQLSEALISSARCQANGRNQEPLALAEVFNSVRADLQPLLRSRQADLQRSQLPTVLGDALQWKTLLSALISNAVSYGPGEVKVALEVSTGIDEHHFLLTDNGPGIPPNLREAVFAPFRRLHTAEEAGGVGLGLTTCREIVNRMGGRIWLSDTATGQGLAVHFTIPTNTKS